MDGYVSTSQKTSLAQLTTITPSLDSVAAQLANSTTLMEDVYKIRHAGYFSYGYIAEQPDGRFVDKYDRLPNVRTAIVYKDQKPAATVRLCLLDLDNPGPGSSTIPAMEIFGNEITALMGPGSGGQRRAVEVTRLARHPDFANDKSVIHALFRVVGYLILFYDADLVLNACRPHHVPMYRRFGFQKMEEPRQYPNLTYKACLMAYFRHNYDVARKTLSFLNGISQDDRAFARLIAGDRIDFGFLPIFATDMFGRSKPNRPPEMAQAA